MYNNYSINRQRVLYRLYRKGYGAGSDCRFRTGSDGGRESYHNGGDAVAPDHAG